MKVLTFDDIHVKYNFENKAMSNTDLMRKGEQIILTPGFMMRYEEINIYRNIDHSIIVNLHPNEGRYWVLVISRDKLGGIKCFDS